MSIEFLNHLRDAVGADQVLTSGDLSAYERDWRGRCHGKALAVVRPGSTAEVAQVVRLALSAGVALVPQGGNTGHVGGGVPDGSGRQIVLSLTRLKRIRGVDALNHALTAEAGCTLQAVQDAAAGHGLLFPLSLAAEGSCTIGGNLATNAGGTQVLRYGSARALCLGLEVVTPQGEVWHGLSALRKDNTGYDLRDLYIGSEGTLGVITAATLRLFARPAATATAWAACPNLQAAVRLLQQLQDAFDARLTAFEIMSHTALEVVARQMPQMARPLPPAPWAALIEISGTHAADTTEPLSQALADALQNGVIANATLAHDLTQARALWQWREAIPLAQSSAGLNIKHDIALPVSAVAAFVTATDAALAARIPGVRLVNFGHLGDGNLHYNVQAPQGTDAAAFLAANEGWVNTLVHDAVQAHGGSFAAEHGIGAVKRDELARRASPVALGLMRAIKTALDPKGLLNPGRVV